MQEHEANNEEDKNLVGIFREQVVLREYEGVKVPVFILVPCNDEMDCGPCAI